MPVFCVHFFFTQNVKWTAMPPRTVSVLNDAGVLIRIGGKPQGELIKMNWEPCDNGTWRGETEIADNIKAMAHEIEGIPDVERTDCKYYRSEVKH